MEDKSTHAYLSHLEGLGHQHLSVPVIAGFDAWYKFVLPPDRNAAILDFGCGMGDFMEYLQHRGYQDIHGADINAELVARSAERTGCPVELLVDLDGYSRQHQGQFDCIHMKDVLEHLDKLQAVNHLGHIRTMLKPGGFIIVSGPQMCGFTSLFTLFNDFTHQALFTERSLRYLLSSAGYLDVVLIKPAPSFSFRPSSLCLRAMRFCWFRLVRLIYLIERPGEEMPAYLGDRIMMTASRGA